MRRCLLNEESNNVQLTINRTSSSAWSNDSLIEFFHGKELERSFWQCEPRATMQLWVVDKNSEPFESVISCLLLFGFIIYSLLFQDPL